jgi:hypothetical protein
LIVVQNLPYASVEWPELHAFAQALNRESKDFVTATHPHAANKVEQAYEIHKDIVQRSFISINKGLSFS